MWFTSFTNARCRVLSWLRWIQSTAPLRSILTLGLYGFYLFLAGGVSRSLFGLLYQHQMRDDDELGVFGGMRIGRGNRSTRRKPAPVPLRPPQIPNDLTWDRARAATMGSRWQTAWAMARPRSTNNSRHFKTNSGHFVFNYLLTCTRHCVCRSVEAWAIDSGAKTVSDWGFAYEIGRNDQWSFKKRENFKF
jgi:hypothetical protein